MTDATAPCHYIPAFKGIYAAFDPIALPLLRVTTGLILMPHGCQKLFGWFGGAGFEKTCVNGSGTIILSRHCEPPRPGHGAP